eukprot:SAG31_NODE_8432_length_1453_cov_1.621861_1_plen_341_part_00
MGTSTTADLARPSAPGPRAVPNASRLPHRKGPLLPGRQRRGRDDRGNLARAYKELYKRIPTNATPEMLAAEFADKELRIIMSQNGMLINNYCPETGRYSEKTKVQKIEALLSVLNTLTDPDAILQRVEASGNLGRAPVEKDTAQLARVSETQTVTQGSVIKTSAVVRSAGSGTPLAEAQNKRLSGQDRQTSSDMGKPGPKRQVHRSSPTPICSAGFLLQSQPSQLPYNYQHADVKETLGSKFFPTYVWGNSDYLLPQTDNGSNGYSVLRPKKELSVEHGTAGTIPSIPFASSFSSRSTLPPTEHTLATTGIASSAQVLAAEAAEAFLTESNELEIFSSQV